MPATTPAHPTSGVRIDRGSTVRLPLDEGVQAAAEAASQLEDRGEVAHYIAQLAEADPDRFALAAIELDGTEHVAGDADEPFPIQSISKVFSLVLAMREADAAGGVEVELWQRLGREPSGEPGGAARTRRTVRAVHLLTHR